MLARRPLLLMGAGNVVNVVARTIARTMAGSRGGEATLLKKVTHIEGDPPGKKFSRWTLPVHTLTFANPNGDTSMPSLGCRIDFGDVVKVEIPG